MQRSPLYTLGFATAICIVCAIVVSAAAVSLRDRQETNAKLERQRNVLLAAGLAGADEKLTADEIERRFEQVEPVVVDLRNGEVAPDIDPLTWDMQEAMDDPELSRPAPDNNAKVRRIPHYGVVYQVRGGAGELELLVLPVEGKGLWSTLYGFLALEADLDTVRGITYYQHGETPGLGGEVDNPRWKEKWVGRRTFDAEGAPAIEVIKGRAKPADEAPYEVDGLSGATLTARGVTYMIHFWLGENGFAPYLRSLQDDATTAPDRRAA